MSQPMRGKNKIPAERFLTANNKKKRLTPVKWQCPGHNY